jgi:flagellar motility protein MotE (MotC chaperone)
MNKLIFLPCIVSLVVLFSCKNEVKEEKTVEHAQSNLVVNQLKAIDDSCSKAWTMMMESDDQKIKDIQRLLQEISYIPGHNESKLQELIEQTKGLAAVRYSQADISSEKIDAYDKATDELLRAVFDLKRNTKGVEQYTLTEELETAIREADGKVVNYRVLYDTWAKQYNDKLVSSEEAQQKFKKKNGFQY